MTRWTVSILAASVLALGVLGGCSRRPAHPAPEIVVTSGDARQRGHGPPPHAPAHGYRHKHGNTELSYDADLRVYVVVGRARVYYHPGEQLYYRLAGRDWEVSAHLDAGWKPIARTAVPARLAGQGKGHAKGKARDDYEVADSER